MKYTTQDLLGKINRFHNLKVVKDTYIAMQYVNYISLCLIPKFIESYKADIQSSTIVTEYYI